MNLPEDLEIWFSAQQQQQYVSLLMRRVGMTRRRAECFVRLWLYLLLKQYQSQKLTLKPPLAELALPEGAIACSCREAAELFYADRDNGSDRASGMMLDKLAALGLIKKHFDGNSTQIEIQPLPELLTCADAEISIPEVQPAAFDPRSDAIPIANLLASNYNWLNRNTDALPYRIANILRDWASQYATGMRVLRRCDNQNPVGFYALYPIQRQSEIKFFSPPSKGMHLSAVSEIDPFAIALPGDPECRAVYVRSWMIDASYRDLMQISFLQDAQQTLIKISQDFPNLSDMYTLVIHPNYEELGLMLGFQKTNLNSKLSVYWMYQAVDRFLALEMDHFFTRPS
jgi:hypothetical protein